MQALLDRIGRDFPASIQPTLIEGARRLVDYQDVDYAALYLDRVQRIARLPGSDVVEANVPDNAGLDDIDGLDGSNALTETIDHLPGGNPGDAINADNFDNPANAGVNGRNGRNDSNDRDALTETVARYLAPWMAYEDAIRVAQLKTCAARFARIRQEAGARDDQVLSIHDFMHPRVQEISETLPAPWGQWLARPGWPRRLVERLTRRGRIIDTTSLRGFMLLYGMAGMKRWRRRSARFAAETRRIEDWLRDLAQAAAIDRRLAREIAQCPRLLKGYGDTHERALRNFDAVMGAVRHALTRPPATPGASLASLDPAVVAELRTAALADDTGSALQVALARHALQGAQTNAGAGAGTRAMPRSGDTA